MHTHTPRHIWCCLATRAENQIIKHDRTVHGDVHAVNIILLVGIENLGKEFAVLA